MKEILISGEIGEWWATTAIGVRRAFEEAGEDDIRLVIDSPGGDCFEGISIYNYIRDFARRNQNRITTYIQGMAASAAAWVALAANSENPANKIEVEDNSVFMVHNSWAVAVGDHRVLEDAAKFCGRIDALINSALAKRSGKSEREIKRMMDDETWLFGGEIVEGGFADSVIKSELVSVESEERTLDSAKARFSSCKEKTEAEARKDPKRYSDSVGRHLRAFDSIAPSSSPQSNLQGKSALPNGNTQYSEAVSMTKAELKAQNPALYDEVFNEGVDSERSRVKAHLEMAESSGDVSAAVELIKNGKGCQDNEAAARYHEVLVKSLLNKKRMEDEPPEFTAPKSAQSASAADEEANRAFASAFGL